MAHANVSLTPTAPRRTRANLPDFTPEEQKDFDARYARYLDFQIGQEVATGGQHLEGSWRFFLDHEAACGEYVLDPAIKEQHRRYKLLMNKLADGGICFGYQSSDAMFKESATFGYCTLSFPEFIEFERKYGKKCDLMSWTKSDEYLQKEREQAIVI